MRSRIFEISSRSENIKWQLFGGKFILENCEMKLNLKVYDLKYLTSYPTASWIPTHAVKRTAVNLTPS